MAVGDLEQQGVDLSNQIGQQALGGTRDSFNFAAGQLRDRLAQLSSQQREGATNEFLSRGAGASDALQSRYGSIDRGTASAYGQGLSELNQNYETNRLRGLEVGNASAGQLLGQSQFNKTLGQRESEFGRTLQEQISSRLQQESQFGRQLGEQQSEFGQTLGQRQSEFSQNLAEQVAQRLQQQAQFGQQLSEQQQEFLKNFGESQRQFDSGQSLQRELQNSKQESDLNIALRQIAGQKDIATIENDPRLLQALLAFLSGQK